MKNPLAASPRLTIIRIVHYALLIGIAVIALYPLAFMALSSFKDNQEFYTKFWGLPGELRWSNYTRVFEEVIVWVRNTVIYSTVNVLFVLATTSLSGYAFARYNFPYKGALFAAILVLLMMPGILLVVPMYAMVSGWGMTNSMWSLVLPWTAVQIPIGTLVMRRFFETQPRALFEAAIMDGASAFRMFRSIALPLATPALSTLAILDVWFSSNDLIWPLLVMRSQETQPIAVGVLSYNGAMGALTWGHVFSAYTLASLPLLIMFILLGRSFANALTEGAIK